MTRRGAYLLVTSDAGRILVAIRENEDRCRYLGLRTSRLSYECRRETHRTSSQPSAPSLPAVPRQPAASTASRGPRHRLRPWCGPVQRPYLLRGAAQDDRRLLPGKCYGIRLELPGV